MCKVINPVIAGIDVTDDFTLVGLDVPPPFDSDPLVPTRAGAGRILFRVRDREVNLRARSIAEAQVCFSDAF